MAKTQREHIKDLLEQALLLQPEDRRAFLENLYSSDAELRGELESLLAHADEGQEYFESLADGILPKPRFKNAILNKGLLVAERYRILDQLGKGGMGIVYLAYDNHLHRKVALKFFLNATLDSSEEIARFHREARAAARLNHPNICTVYELGETEDKTFIAMEYVEGITLKMRMQQGNISEAEIRRWLKQIGEGLLVAHDSGVIHRDIKPANIMITARGLIKIMDFGIAKLTEAETELTRANSTIGTIAYMSPEQAHGEVIDHRTDIWSVGVILYELVTGQRPFQGAFRESIVYAMMYENVRSPIELNPDVSNDLERVTMKCLERKREERYTSLSALLSDLKDETLSEVTETRPAIRQLFNLRRNGRIYFYWAVAMVFIGIVGLGIYSWQSWRIENVPVTIAVLPLESIVEDKEQDWFANGITDALNY